MQQRPSSLLGAAGVQAAEAVIVLVASMLAGVDTAAGQSYQTGSGIALTLIGLCHRGRAGLDSRRAGPGQAVEPHTSGC